MFTKRPKYSANVEDLIEWDGPRSKIRYQYVGPPAKEVNEEIGDEDVFGDDIFGEDEDEDEDDEEREVEDDVCEWCGSHGDTYYGIDETGLCEDCRENEAWLMDDDELDPEEDREEILRRLEEHFEDNPPPKVELNFMGQLAVAGLLVAGMAWLENRNKKD